MFYRSSFPPAVALLLIFLLFHPAMASCGADMSGLLFNSFSSIQHLNVSSIQYKNVRCNADEHPTYIAPGSYTGQMQISAFSYSSLPGKSSKSTDSTLSSVNPIIELCITDPVGRKTGYTNPSDTILDEIPLSAYGRSGVPCIKPDPHVAGPTEWQQLDISRPLSGAYKLQVIGIKSGVYSLECWNIANEAYSEVREERRIITSNTIYSYCLTFNQNKAHDFKLIKNIAPGEIAHSLHTAFDLNWIDNECNLISLTEELEHAESSIARGHIITAVNDLNAFVKEVQAQSGKHINKAAADILISDARAYIKQIQGVQNAILPHSSMMVASSNKTRPFPDGSDISEIYIDSASLDELTPAAFKKEFSPCFEYCISDPLKRKTGYIVSSPGIRDAKNVVEEIPDSQYLHGGRSRAFRLLKPLSGTYIMQVIGTREGAYQMYFTLVGAGWPVKNKKFREIYRLTSPGTIHNFRIIYDRDDVSKSELIRIVTALEIKNSLKLALRYNWIDSRLLAYGLISRIEHAESAVKNGETDKAVKDLEAFIKEVEVQKDKHIRREAADILVSDAQAYIKCLPK